MKERFGKAGPETRKPKAEQGARKHEQGKKPRQGDLERQERPVVWEILERRAQLNESARARRETGQKYSQKEQKERREEKQRLRGELIELRKEGTDRDRLIVDLLATLVAGADALPFSNLDSLSAKKLQQVRSKVEPLESEAAIREEIHKAQEQRGRRNPWPLAFRQVILPRQPLTWEEQYKKQLEQNRRSRQANPEKERERQRLYRQRRKERAEAGDLHYLVLNHSQRERNRQRRKEGERTAQQIGQKERGKPQDGSPERRALPGVWVVLAHRLERRAQLNESARVRRETGQRYSRKEFWERQEEEERRIEELIELRKEGTDRDKLIIDLYTTLTRAPSLPNVFNYGSDLSPKRFQQFRSRVAPMSDGELTEELRKAEEAFEQKKKACEKANATRERTRNNKQNQRELTRRYLEERKEERSLRREQRQQPTEVFPTPPAKK